MKRKSRIILAAGIVLTMLAGCEKTPEEVIVKEKNKNSMANYETSESTGKSIQEQVEAPEEYKNNISLENGKLVIDTDASVLIPEAESVNTIGVKAKEINQPLLDKVTKVFFGENPIYDSFYYNQMTKEYIQKQITILKKYAAEGNMDPYGYGTDADGNAAYDIYAQIEGYEESYKTAPDSVELKEVTPQFGIEYKNEDGTVNKQDNHFSGVAETDQGKYEYSIMKMGGDSKEITFKIKKKREDFDPHISSGWLSGAVVRDKEAKLSIPEDKLKKYADISYENAEKDAMDKVEKLDLEGMELAGWDYSIFYVGEEGLQTEDSIKDVGYEFYFTRKMGGVPITYTMSYGGGLQSMESTEVPWGYEVLKIIVGDDGIQEVELINPYEMGEIQKKNVVLMKFDEIVKIYEQMMEVSNADIIEKQRTYHIKKIKFGYTRIYDPKADNGSGLLVPVWDFFGGTDIEVDGYSEKSTGDYSTQSFMTINAIDGTIIDRELGY